MSEKFLKIFLSDVKKIRVVCKKGDCTGVAEMDVGHLKNSLLCPDCGKKFLPLVLEAQGLFGQIADTIARLEKLEPDFKVEFVTSESIQ